LTLTTEVRIFSADLSRADRAAGPLVTELAVVATGVSAEGLTLRTGLVAGIGVRNVRNIGCADIGAFTESTFALQAGGSIVAIGLLIAGLTGELWLIAGLASAQGEGQDGGKESQGGASHDFHFRAHDRQHLKIAGTSKIVLRAWEESQRHSFAKPEP
jgi:hypothetical protein